MEESAAAEAVGLRERKRIATRDALIAAARELAATHGFSHFTIEELCERVGVSRRTFFNYFPSKEAALFGAAEEGIPADVAEAFVRGGNPTADPRPSNLLGDLADVLLAVAETMPPLSREGYESIRAAVERDPKLLPLILQSIDRRDAAIRELVARREGIAADGLRARMAAALLNAVAHQTMLAFFEPDNALTYRELLLRHLDAARHVVDA